MEARTAAEQLRAREEVRQARRSLKASGDWLGVQGADPWTGEVAVLTPTDTVSSDTTTPSARHLLATLAGHRKLAERACDYARDQEALGQDRVRAARARGKLQKMERRKEELLRQQQQKQQVTAGGGGDSGDAEASGGGGGLGTMVARRWKQRKGQWSSIAEPNLSPIPQSVNNSANSKLGGSFFICV